MGKRDKMMNKLSQSDRRSEHSTAHVRRKTGKNIQFNNNNNRHIDGWKRTDFTLCAYVCA